MGEASTMRIGAVRARVLDLVRVIAAAAALSYAGACALWAVLNLFGADIPFPLWPIW